MIRETEINRHVRFWFNYSEDMKTASQHGAETAWRTLAADLAIFSATSRNALVEPRPELLAASISCMKGHSSGVSGALLLPEGKGVLSWSDDGTLRTWDMDGSECSTFKGHSGSVSGALLLPDGKGLLSWSNDGTLRTWNLDGTERRIFKGHSGSVSGALLLPDGKGVLSWGQDGTLRTWNLDGRGIDCWICPTGPISEVLLATNDLLVVMSQEHVHILKQWAFKLFSN